MSSPTLTEIVTEDYVRPVARDISRHPLPHALGLVAAVLVVALLAVGGGALMGGAGVVFGLFLGFTAMLGLGVTAYLLGAVGLVDLLRRTADRV